jgi:hypothetical protein
MQCRPLKMQGNDPLLIFDLGATKLRTPRRKRNFLRPSSERRRRREWLDESVARKSSLMKMTRLWKRFFDQVDMGLGVIEQALLSAS